MKHGLTAVSESWREFEATKLVNARTLWLKRGSSLSANGGADKYRQFCSNYAYAVPASPCFRSVEFDRQDMKKLIAERYGGSGIGQNGGGGRCGNLGPVQLKGVGVNCMVGAHDNKEHSYGGLDARKAIVETIYSCVLGNVLPLGTVAIHGLILTGEKTGFNGTNPCWGVILVRDHCIRPGHFMRAPAFKPRPAFQGALVDDVARIRRLNKQLAKDFKQTNEFIKWIGGYLQHTANQFAFARAARITHGTISASNLSWDGRWLDLPVASFLSGGVNYAIWTQFYSEHNAALSYALEMIHNFGKYNRLVLNPRPLVDYFNEQFEAYFQHYVGYVLGLDLALVPQLPQDAWRAIGQTFMRIIHAGKHIEPRRPTPDENDPIHALIIASYLSRISSALAAPYFIASGLKAEETIEYSGNFNRIIDEYIKQKRSFSNCLSRGLITGTLLKALKRAWMAEIWYLPAVDTQAVSLCNEKTPDDIKPFIDNYDMMAEWVFSRDDSIVLFRNESLEMTYSPDKESYCLRDQGVSAWYPGFSPAYEAIMALPASRLVINQVDFRRFMKRFLKVLTPLETKSARGMETEYA